MKLSVSAVLLFATSTLACWNYNHCKCRDSRTGMLNTEATNYACGKYRDSGGRMPVFEGGGYGVNPRCSNDHVWIGLMRRGGINNCHWDRLCKEFDPNMYQHCWNW